MVAYSFRGTVPGTHSLNAWTQIVDDPAAPERDRDHAGARRDQRGRGHARAAGADDDLGPPAGSRGSSRVVEVPLSAAADRSRRSSWWSGLAPIYRQIRIYVQPLRADAVRRSTSFLRSPTRTERSRAAWSRSTPARCQRQLGASAHHGSATMTRVIVPNLGEGILNATLLTVALVLGEFTAREPAPLHQPPDGVIRDQPAPA